MGSLQQKPIIICVFFCASEWDTIKYHKDSVSVNNVRCPYCFIKRLIIGG